MLKLFLGLCLLELASETLAVEACQRDAPDRPKQMLQEEINNQDSSTLNKNALLFRYLVSTTGHFFMMFLRLLFLQRLHSILAFLFQY